MDDPVLMGMPQSGTNLLEIMKSTSERDLLGSGRFLKVAALHILQNEVMKDRAGKVAGSAMAQAADDVRVADPVECDRLVLKVLNEGSFEVCIKVILKEYIKCLDDDLPMRGLRRSERIAGDEDLGVTSPTEKFDHVIPFVDPAIA